MKHREILSLLIGFSFLFRLSLEIEIRLICFRSLYFHGTDLNIPVLASNPTHLLSSGLMRTDFLLIGKFIGEQIEPVLSDQSLSCGIVNPEHCGALGYGS